MWVVLELKGGGRLGRTPPPSDPKARIWYFLARPDPGDEVCPRASRVTTLSRTAGKDPHL